jgi:hypothetical protein
MEKSQAVDGGGKPRERRRRIPALLNAVAWLFVAVSAGIWGFAAVHAVRDVILYVPAHIISSGIRRGVTALDETVDRRIAVAFVSRAGGNDWTCSLWQRAAYPRSVFCIDTSRHCWQAELAELREQYDVRFLLADGTVPASIPVLTRRPLTASVEVVEIAK